MEPSQPPSEPSPGAPDPTTGDTRRPDLPEGPEPLQTEASLAPPSPGAEPSASGATAHRAIWSLTKSGRFVWVMQWWAPVIIAFWVLLGRGLVGAGLGLLALLGFLPIGGPLLVALYLPALFTLGDDDVRIARTTRFAYSVGACFLWGILLVTGLFVPDGDSGPIPSAVMTWTSGRITIDQSVMIMTVGIWIAVAADFVLICLALAGAGRPQLLKPDDASPSKVRRGAVLTGFWIWWAALGIELASIVSTLVYDTQGPSASIFLAVDFEEGWIVLEGIVVLVAPFFVLRLLGRSRVARIVLAALAVGVIIGVNVLTTSFGAPSFVDYFVAILLVIGTVPLFVPSSNRYFSRRAGTDMNDSTATSQDTSS